jgi:hypothetical protein
VCVVSVCVNKKAHKLFVTKRQIDIEHRSEMTRFLHVCWWLHPRGDCHSVVLHSGKITEHEIDKYKYKSDRKGRGDRVRERNSLCERECVRRDVFVLYNTTTLTRRGLCMYEYLLSCVRVHRVKTQ